MGSGKERRMRWWGSLWEVGRELRTEVRMKGGREIGIRSRKGSGNRIGTGNGEGGEGNRKEREKGSGNGLGMYCGKRIGAGMEREGRKACQKINKWNGNPWSLQK
jgi:hypothetical protein